MKKVVTILLLSIFSLHAFYSAGVVLWFHLNKSYIVSVLCENRAKPEKKCAGNCVLSKKSKQETKEKSLTVQWVEIAPCFISTSQVNIYTTSIISSYKMFEESAYIFTPDHSIFRPPLG